MTRRGFLGRLFALAAVASIPSLAIADPARRKLSNFPYTEFNGPCHSSSVCYFYDENGLVVIKWMIRVEFHHRLPLVVPAGWKRESVNVTQDMVTRLRTFEGVDREQVCNLA